MFTIAFLHTICLTIIGFVQYFPVILLLCHYKELQMHTRY